MRVVLFANNRVSIDIAKCIRSHGDDIVGLVLHPVEKRTYGSDIISSAGCERIFDGSELSDPLVLSQIAELSPEIAMSSGFSYILRQPMIDLFPKGCVNLHPSYLPYNRGSFPNVWSILDGTPAGVTLHYINAGVDTGDMIAQMRVSVEPSDTSETLFRKLETAGITLFQENWASIRAGSCARIPQGHETGRIHKRSDVNAIDEIHLDKEYTGRYLIDLLRARTFTGFKGAYFVENGKKIYLRIQLTPEDESS
jgi:methionyl-tRNA formyltransferase